MKMVPGKPEGYLYTASSLRELGRRDEALQTLLSAVERFPDDEIILYDLACVCCMLRRVEEARGWLAKAIDVGGDKIKDKERALDDPDLEPLWKEIGSI